LEDKSKSLSTRFI